MPSTGPPWPARATRFTLLADFHGLWWNRSATRGVETLRKMQKARKLARLQGFVPAREEPWRVGARLKTIAAHPTPVTWNQLVAWFQKVNVIRRAGMVA